MTEIIPFPKKYLVAILALAAVMGHALSGNAFLGLVTVTGCLMALAILTAVILTITRGRNQDVLKEDLLPTLEPVAPGLEAHLYRAGYDIRFSGNEVYLIRTHSPPPER